MLARTEFGRTGHQSSRVIFGAAGLGSLSQDQADMVLPMLRRFGVNHLDTASSYGDSELRIRPWLAGQRDEYFLATKTDARDGDGARASLERSLERLGVDQVDLIQHHDLVEEDEWQEAHSTGGAVEALARAREEGLVRFIGITGHGLRIPSMHLRSLERFAFDSVIFPYNYSLLSIDSYRRDVEELIAVCLERDIAIQTIKSVARRRWSDGTSFGDHQSWYEPLRDDSAIARAVGFVLGRQPLFLISSSDHQVLEAILSAAETEPSVPSNEELEADQARFEVAPLFDGGELERI